MKTTVGRIGVTALVLVACLALWPGSSRADIVAADTFTIDAGAGRTTGASLDGLSVETGTGTWSVTGTGTFSFAADGTVTASANTDDSPMATVAADNTKFLRVSADLKITKSWWGAVGFADTGNWFKNSLSLLVATGGDYWVNTWDSAGVQTTIASGNVTLNLANTLAIQFDPATTKVTAWINSVPLVSDYDLGRAVAFQRAGFRFHKTAAAGPALPRYADNFKLEIIPEPASMTLILLGSSLIAHRRNHDRSTAK